MGVLVLVPPSKGRQKKQNGKTTYICASSQNKVRTYTVKVRFWAFLGNRQQVDSRVWPTDS
jgi:hypothetical protein